MRLTDTEKENYLDTSNMVFFEDGESSVTTKSINALANIIYPVGSVYESVNNISPATLFGGTWVELPAEEEHVYLVESVNNGNSYMRRYSDGWLEQGGYTTTVAATSQLFTFPYPFAGTNYKFWATNAQISDAGIVVYAFQPANATQCYYTSGYNGSCYAEGMYWNAEGWGPVPDSVSSKQTTYRWKRTL